MIVNLAFLLAATYVISKSADFLILAASGLGRQFRLKDYLIGSLIVGIGTSLPELFTSLAAINEGEAVLVAPTIYGTVIANIGAGLGLAVVGLHLFVSRGGTMHLFASGHPVGGSAIVFGTTDGRSAAILHTPIVFAVFSVIFSYFVCADGTFSRLDAFWFFLGYLAFMHYELRIRNDVASAAPPSDGRSVHSDTKESVGRAAGPEGAKRPRLLFIRAVKALWLSLLAFALILTASLVDDSPFERADSLPIFLAGLAGLIGAEVILVRSWFRCGCPTDLDGHAEDVTERWPKIALLACLALSLVAVFYAGTLLVRSVVDFAGTIGIGSTALAASVIAVGTSVPDIVVALKVARQGRHALLIGHIVQSNIFDVFLIMAICGFVSPLPIDIQTSTFTVPFTIALTFCLLPMFRNKRIGLAEGLLLFLGLLIFLTGLYV